MRFLKSLLALLLVVCASVSRAQDTSFVSVDTAFNKTEKDTMPVFHADKPAGMVVWQERAVPDSTLRQLRRDEAFWYANAEFKHKALSEKGQHSFLISLFRQEWFYNLLWAIIVISFIAVMVLFLIKSNPWLFRKKATLLSAIEETAITENIFSINYDAELKNALMQNNHRLAVRLQYLQLLKLLSDKKLIQYKEGRTNNDYLLQLYATPYYKDFKNLTRHFEYAWYGQFSITPEVYTIIEAEFVTFKHSMDI